MNKFLELFTDGSLLGETGSALTVEGFFIGLLFAFVMSVIMCVVYRFCQDPLSYNKKFNTVLVMMAMISTVLLHLIQSNVLLSLGVLGSLSICRFRTNTRDARDIGFIFWSITIGIAASTGSYLIGALCTLVLAAIMLITNVSRKERNSQTLVIRGEGDQVEEVNHIMDAVKGKSRVMAKNIHREQFELVYEMKMNEQEERDLVMKLKTVDAVNGINILAPGTQVA